MAYQERKKETLQHPVLESQVEIGLLRDAIETDPQLRESLYDRHDASG